MLEDLLAYLASSDLEDDPLIRVDSVEFSGDDARLRLSVMDHAAREVWTTWQIEATRLRDYAIREAIGDLSLNRSDHVLARQHTDTQQKLFFNGKPRSVSATIGELLVAHDRVTEGWIPFQQYLNGSCELDQLLAGGFGVVADGPSFLVNSYVSVLSDQGMAPSLLEPFLPRWWNGSEWVTARRTLATLVIGESYFVAEEFRARRTSEQAEHA